VCVCVCVCVCARARARAYTHKPTYNKVTNSTVHNLDNSKYAIS